MVEDPQIQYLVIAPHRYYLINFVNLIRAKQRFTLDKTITV